jgi:signal transduction histidine kinase/ActR/RegA family two-component response regulator
MSGPRALRENRAMPPTDQTAAASEGATSRPEHAPLFEDAYLQLWAQYDAIAQAIMAAQVDTTGDHALDFALADDGLRFEFLRLGEDGALSVPYAWPGSGPCPALLGDDALMRRAIDSGDLVVEDGRDTAARVHGAPDIALACGRCTLVPNRLTLVMPVRWHSELIGVCRIVRCSATVEWHPAERFFIARLAETIAASEKYRRLRLQCVVEEREVARKEHQLKRLGHWRGLANRVSCDGTYAVDLGSGEVSVEYVGDALHVRDWPPTVDAVAWWRRQIHPNDLRLWARARLVALSSPRTPHTIEYRVAARDGDWLHVRQSHLFDPGVADEPGVLVGVVKDITSDVVARERLHAERVQMEALVQQRTQELTEANTDLARAARLKDEFLASMSHELRTPLNAILGLTEATREGVWGSVTSAQDERLQLVEESGRHLLSLINDILDLAKIGAGKLMPEIGAVDVVGTAAATLRLVAQLALEKRVQLESQLPDDGPVIDTDGRMLKQMLLNLLNNAVKFTPAGGHVRLEVECGPDVLTFRVIDTGIGIAADEMRRIFRPFVQVNQGLARAYGGTGLGLALVARLADVLHGSVEAESEPGRGSVFTLRLPAHNGAVTPRRPSQPEASPRRRKSVARATVLLAEDDDATARTYVGYLVAKGYNVLLARDGEAALQLARDVQPALILMDIQMPKLDGLEAIRQLRADPSFAETPIIALSALATPSDRDRCLAAGASAFITKPTSLRELRASIARFIGVPDAGELQ